MIAVQSLHPSLDVALSLTVPEPRGLGRLGALHRHTAAAAAKTGHALRSGRLPLAVKFDWVLDAMQRLVLLLRAAAAARALKRALAGVQAACQPHALLAAAAVAHAALRLHHLQLVPRVRS
jgi:hypothetical protein